MLKESSVSDPIAMSVTEVWETEALAKYLSFSMVVTLPGITSFVRLVQHA